MAPPPRLACAVPFLSAALALLQVRPTVQLQSHSTSLCGGKKQVLVVIDMQNDYSLEYNNRTYHRRQNPFAADFKPPDVVDEIEGVISGAVPWDMVVFSQDWLVPELLTAYQIDANNHSFCIRDTDGAEVLSPLLDAAEEKVGRDRVIKYKKNVDNLFNEIQQPTLNFSRPDDYPDRCFDMSGEWGGATFQELLTSWDYLPDDTQLTFVGTISDMCVLTSAVNAATNGYSVQVYVPGINGRHSEPDAGWFKCNTGTVPVDVSSACCVPVPANNMPEGWQRRVSDCQLGAGFDNALSYMGFAGVQLLEDSPPSCSQAVGAVEPHW